MSGLLIRGGTVIDGSGSPGQRADIRVRDNRIAEIAPRLNAEGETVIDATGAVVAPGFIDPHTHLDTAIYWDPSCNPMAQHGVTTGLLGNCSLGLAPLRSADRTEISALFSYIEDIPMRDFTDTVPWRWETFEEYTTDLAGMKFGMNVLMLVSHSLLRGWVMGKEAWERAATPEEADRIVAELERALRAGAAGLSYSSFDKDPSGRVVPSYYADDAELEKIFRSLAAKGGIFQPIVCSGPDMFPQMQRIGDFARRHGVVVLHNGLLNVETRPEQTQGHLETLAKIKATGAQFYSMLSPKPFFFDINFHQSFCFQNISAWNEIIQLPREGKVERLRDPEWRARARRDVDAATDTPLFPINRMDLLAISAVGSPEFRPWIGRTLADLVKERGGHRSDVLADWVVENNLEAHFSNPLGNADPEGVGRLLHIPSAVIGGSDVGAHQQLFCTHGDTTLLLTRHVRDRGDIALEDAIHRLTGQIAGLLNLRDRGLLKVGMAADITVFALNELRYDREVLVDDQPGGACRLTRPDGGFRYTIVGGVIVQDHGKTTGALPARFLRHGAGAPQLPERGAPAALSN